MASWVEAREWTRVETSPFDTLPAGIECRTDGRTSVLMIAGTDKLVGFNTQRFDPANLQALLQRLMD